MMAFYRTVDGFLQGVDSASDKLFDFEDASVDQNFGNSPGCSF